MRSATVDCFRLVMVLQTRSREDLRTRRFSVLILFVCTAQIAKSLSLRRA